MSRAHPVLGESVGVFIVDDLIQLAVVGNTVELAIVGRSARDVAGIDNAVEVAVLVLELAFVGDSVAITVPERVRDVTVIGKQVAVAVRGEALLDLVGIRKLVAVAVLAFIGDEVAIDVGTDPSNDVATIKLAVAIAVDGAELMQQSRESFRATGDPDLVDRSLQHLIRQTGVVGVAADTKCTLAHGTAEGIGRNDVHLVIQDESGDRGFFVPCHADVVPVGVVDLKKARDRPCVDGRTVPKSESKDEFSPGDP